MGAGFHTAHDDDEDEEPVFEDPLSVLFSTSVILQSPALLCPAFVDCSPACVRTFDPPDARDAADAAPRALLAPRVALEIVSLTLSSGVLRPPKSVDISVSTGGATDLA